MSDVSGPWMARRRFLRWAAGMAIATPLSSEVLALPSRSVEAGVGGDGEIFLANESLEIRWRVAENRLRALRIRDRSTGDTLELPADIFAFSLAGGRNLRSSEMRVVEGPRVRRLDASRNSSRSAERAAGRSVDIRFADSQTGAVVAWRALIRDGGSYVRQEVSIEAGSAELPVREIVLLDLDAPGAEVIGTVPGSPVVSGNLFFGFESPLSSSTVEGTRLRCFLKRALPVRAHRRFVCSSVIGVTPPGQRRRGFLDYVERERAHPYRSFLHYNSWYDLGAGGKYDAAAALAAIDAFGTELLQKRGVAVDSFLFDDGWDDSASLWKFDSGFPDGFAPLRDESKRYRSAPGVWLSPWGGYGEPKQERLKYAGALGFETQRNGFALSGPKYYRYFRDVCAEMIQKYGVNQFKFDGTGNADTVIDGSDFDSDFDAALHLTDELRGIKPDLYVNLTTGTYPSPFWLRHVDSIWRGGYDHSFAGVGSYRQRWITYRDAATYANVVKAGPLYPLNSVMLHGIIYARVTDHLHSDPNGDIESEIRSYFGTGTQLQEMYITPSLLGKGEWDTLAEAAGWARRNAGVLVDTHWIGGDPGALQPYGWASWNAEKGTVTLRNPGDQPQTFDLDVAAAFELPHSAARRFLARSPWRSERGEAPISLQAGQSQRIELAPFAVRTLEATPV